jgi:hypothetical protein
MSLDVLLLRCLRHGTSYTERKVPVTIQPQSGETILFFITDSDAFRQDLKVQGPVCDLVILYSQSDTQETVICLVELKGRDLRHAAEQIQNTYTTLIRSFEQSLRSLACRHHMQLITWKACICQGITTTDQRDVATVKQELKPIFGNNVDVLKKGRDFDKFLRRT